jgi:uncharacterized membrane protein
MQAYQIVLLAFFIVIFLYVTSAFFVISRALDFRSKLSRRLDALTVLLLERRTALEEIYSFVVAKGVCGDELRAKHEAFSSYETKIKDGDAFDAAQKALKEFQTELMFDVQKIKEEDRSAKLNQEIARLRDLESSHRRTVVLYNSDCNAFNYWVGVPLFRLLCYIVRLRKKILLN